MFIFIMESMFIFITIINFGHVITQDSNIFIKKYSVTYSVVLASLWLLFSLIQNHKNLIISPFLIVASIGILMIIDAKKPIFDLVLGFICMTPCYVVLVVFMNGLMPSLVKSNFFLIIVFMVLNFLALAVNAFIRYNHLTKPIEFFWKTKINIGFIFVFIMTLIIAIISGVVKKYVSEISINAIQLLSILFFITIIGIIIFWFNHYKHQLENEKLNKKIELSNELKDYVTTIRASRHEFNSHLTTINQLVNTTQYDELSKYTASLLTENDYLQSVSGIKFPEVSALLYRHKMFAKKSSIEFDITFDSNLAKIPIELYDLNKLLNNLLSNALEASISDESTALKQVELIFNQLEGKTSISVSNNGHIPSVVSTKMFTPGVTSKNDTEHGFGLFIIEQIVQVYAGEISIQENNNMVTIEIVI